MRKHMKSRIGLTLADALYDVLTRRDPSNWWIFRPIDCPTDLIDGLEYGFSPYFSSTRIVKKYVAILPDGSIPNRGRHVFLAQDLNANDWVACHDNEMHEFVEYWMCHLTRNWPGDYRDFIKELETAFVMRKFKEEVD
ncbi:MAG: hypothetical protein OXF23_04785 [Candidatus Dadabacteria bacterium]|nr:hypothetical protein [Candidatus Dadabacteria bacterium]